MFHFKLRYYNIETGDEKSLDFAVEANGTELDTMLRAMIKAMSLLGCTGSFISLELIGC